LIDIYTPYTFPNQVITVLTLVGMPICTLLGGICGTDDIARQRERYSTCN
jgi:hypothetical protein